MDWIYAEDDFDSWHHVDGHGTSVGRGVGSPKRRRLDTDTHTPSSTPSSQHSHLFTPDAFTTPTDFFDDYTSSVTPKGKISPRKNIIPVVDVPTPSKVFSLLSPSRTSSSQNSRVKTPFHILTTSSPIHSSASIEFSDYSAYNSQSDIFDDMPRRKGTDSSTPSKRTRITPIRPKSPPSNAFIIPDVIADEEEDHDFLESEYHSPESSSNDPSSETVDAENMDMDDTEETDERIGDVVVRKLKALICVILEHDAEESASSAYNAPDISSDPILSSSASYSKSSSLFLPVETAEESLLHTATIDRLSKLIGKVARHTRLQEIGEELFSTLIKVLERSVRKMQYLSLSDIVVGDSSDYEEDSTEVLCSAIEDRLSLISNGAKAATCIFSILSSASWSKQMHSEDTIAWSLDMLKSQLVQSVYITFEEKSQPCEVLHRYAEHRLERCRKQLGRMLIEMTTLLSSICTLFRSPSIRHTDNVLIPAAYLALSPFFIDTQSGFGTKTFDPRAIECLRLEALGLLEGIFSLYEDQRQWILEEILTSLIKLPTNKKHLRQYKLPDGRSIQTVSALMMILVQSCAAAPHGHGEAHAPDHEEPSTEAFEVWHRDWRTALESVNSNVTHIWQYLCSRCTKSAAKGSTTEAQYRLAFDNFLEDVLGVINLPEWPVAEIFIRSVSRKMMGFVDEISNHDNYKILMATEVLGSVAVCMLKQGCAVKELLQSEDVETSEILQSLVSDESLSMTSKPAVRHLLNAELQVLGYLDEMANSERDCRSARALSLCQYGVTFSDARNAVIASSQEDEEEIDSELSDAEVIGTDNLNDRISTCIHRLRKTVSGVVELAESPSRELAVRIALLLGQRQPLFRNLDAIIARILVVLERDGISQRSKALKALSQITNVDPSVLNQVNVQETVAKRLTDISPSVRDSAVDFVGRYMATDATIRGQYYKAVGERVLDRATNVRKRVVRLLKEIYTKTLEIEAHLRTDIIVKLLHRTEDDEAGVRELAFKSLQGLLFQSVPGLSFQKKSDWASLSTKLRLIVKLRVEDLVDICAGQGSQKTILEKFLRDCLNKGEDKKDAEDYMVAEFLALAMDYLNEALFSSQNEEDSPMETINGLRTINCLSMACPALMNASRTTRLLPYLKGCSTPQDRLVSCEVLRIYRASVPSLKLPGIEFCQHLQTILSGLLNRADPVIVREALPCFVALVDKHTKDYERLVNLVRSLLKQLASERDKHKKGQEINVRNVSMFLLIMGLICKHFDFAANETQLGRKLIGQLQTVVGRKRTVLSYAFDIAYYYTGSSFESMPHGKAIRRQALESLGWMCETLPSMLTMENSITLIETVLEAGDADLVNQVLCLFRDFLRSEQPRLAKSKPNRRENGRVDMKELIGNAEDFADAGVAGPTMQRFLPAILDAAVGPNDTNRYLACEVIEQIVVQGLAHPLLLTPTIVALSGRSDLGDIRRKALTILTNMHTRHSSLIHTRFVECAQRAAKLYDLDVELLGRHPELEAGAFDNWYAFVSEKRARRNDFIKSLVDAVDVGERQNTLEKSHVRFCAFVVDNLARLEFKTQEEVLLVVHYCIRILAVTGGHTFHQLQCDATDGDELRSSRSSVSSTTSTIFDRQSAGPSSRATSVDNSEGEVKIGADESSSTMSLFHASSVSCMMSMILKLKEYIKAAYGLSEEKCQAFIPSRTKTDDKDKPVTKRTDLPPLPCTDLLHVWVVDPSEDQMRAQCRQFAVLMALESTMVEEEASEDDEMYDVETPSKRSTSRSVTPSTAPVPRKRKTKRIATVTQRRPRRSTAGKRKRDVYEAEGRGEDDDQSSSSEEEDSGDDYA